MARHRLLILGVGALLATAHTAAAAPPPTGRDQAADSARDAQALAVKIDQYLAARWAASKVQPAPAANDAEYLRRVFLDLAGRIPSVAEVRAFLRDPSSIKRRQVVEKLLDSPAYINHSSNVWRSLLLPEVEATQDFQLRSTIPGFEAWLREQFTGNIGYDKVVRQLLTASPGSNGQRSFNPYGEQGPEPNPLAFYVAKEFKPENLGASTARLFLGIKLECAQCHNHPFAKWSRQQFWEYSAFFAGFGKPNGVATIGVYGMQEMADRRELAIQGTGQVVQAAFLDGSEPQFKYKVNSRITLADWLTARDNPFFARAAVNRVWAQFFGIGIVEPVDDLSEQNIPSHPELLDELAREFAAHDFDLKFLIRAITATRAYQLSSSVVARSGDRATARSGDHATAAPDPRLFACMAVKGLSSEQLFESIALATGYRVQPMERNQVYFGGNTPRAEFLAKFTSPDKRTEYQTSILQALSLMNGKFVADATSLDKSATLAAVAEAPFLDTAGQIETLYLSALSRQPRPEESARLVKYVKAGGPKKNSKAALGDVFWALLNSSEFILNH